MQKEIISKCPSCDEGFVPGTDVCLECDRGCPYCAGDLESRSIERVVISVVCERCRWRYL